MLHGRQPPRIHCHGVKALTYYQSNVTTLDGRQGQLPPLSPYPFLHRAPVADQTVPGQHQQRMNVHAEGSGDMGTTSTTVLPLTTFKPLSMPPVDPDYAKFYKGIRSA